MENVVPDAVSVTVTTGRAPELIMFQDGIDADWKAATKKTDTSYELSVTGPYSVTVVCQADNGAAWQVWQTSTTPKESKALTALCPAATTPHTVTGQMLQAGHIQLGAASGASDTTSWAFSLALPNGTYDLVAASSDGFAVRRGIAVTGDLVIAAPIDVATEGKALTSAVFTVSNLPEKSKESIVASLSLSTKSSPAPTTLFSGDAAKAKVAGAGSLAADDVQTVVLSAVSNDTTPDDGKQGKRIRALRRAFKAGDKTAIALPGGFVDASWKIDAGRVSFIAAPALVFDTMQVTAIGVAGDGKIARHVRELSPGYVDATSLAREILDNDIPGFKAEWKLDVKKPIHASAEAATEVLDDDDKPTGDTTLISATTELNAAP